MEEYKPFALTEQYDPVAGTTVYYNNAKTLACKKNDCVAKFTSSEVTLTANEKKFVSQISTTDANEQAQSWLTANVQAYANNLGTCFRATKWRGINASCVIEPTTELMPFDYMIIKYKWALGAGKDLDTFTGFINTGTEWDNKYMGYGHGFGNSLVGNNSTTDPYMLWAGDNTSDNGIETCLVNFTKITTDYPVLKTVQVRMAAAWYARKESGDIDIEVTTYQGGTMSKVGYDITSKGGTQMQQLVFSKNVSTTPWDKNINNVTNIGYITYTKSSGTGRITLTY